LDPSPLLTPSLRPPPCPLQGWTPDFIPKVLEDAQALNLYDELVAVSGPESIATAKLLASKEGIFTGISGGATMVGSGRGE